MNQFFNASSDSDDSGDGYIVTYRREAAAMKAPRPARPIPTRRRGKTPVQFNGIHRRRNKKIRW
jgi:hypothetical protein